MKRSLDRQPAPATVRIRKHVTALLLAGGLVVLAGCSSNDPDAAPPSDASSSSAAETPTPSASATTVDATVIAVYGAYWREMEKLYADSTGRNAQLDKYAASAALKNAESDAKRAHDRGRIYTGSVALTDQTVTKVDASGKVPNATVSSCLDISKWRRVDAETKKPVAQPENRLTKYRILSTVEKYPEGWRVTRDDPQGKSC
ncbi:hypothetical protein [Streptomyces griseorubiginosus]|uniref:hypothetical protein n=1 Tax=Streptomyces griseorubiginosus TaxID=67304 RepID=UPI0033FCE04E